jgi:3-(3-hydroxy-phenyl)propionate hydroxylase
MVLAETERLFADWLDHHAIAAVIVRPDRYVFAGAQAAEELNSHISTLAGLLGAARLESDRPRG